MTSIIKEKGKIISKLYKLAIRGIAVHKRIVRR